MHIENWNGYDIRFVESNGIYAAVAGDVAKAMGYREAEKITRMLPDHLKGPHNVGGLENGRMVEREMTVIPEQGLYFVFARSRRPEAESFLLWLTELCTMMRQQLQFEQFHAFKMLDKENQQLMMDRIHDCLEYIPQEHYQKVNQITNELTSVRFGYERHITKDQMNRGELAFRQEILKEVVHLHETNLKYNMNIDIFHELSKRFK